VRRRIRQIQPDLVHGHGTEYESAICAVFSGYPNVVTLLGIMREMAQIMKARPGSFYWFASALESLVLRRTAGVLANSRFTEEKIRSRTPRTWIVSNAVREIFFQRAPGLKREGPPILLNAGLICANKRQNELLDVTDTLHSEGLKFQLQFLGVASNDNPYAVRFLERIKKSPYATHHGFKTVAEMLEYYDRASGLVHVSEIESFGLVVAEALARNLKFVGFKTAGVADIITGVEGAEGFEDLDWSSVKAALRNWIAAGSVRPKTAADTMRERFHPVRIARNHLDLYREVLELISTPTRRK
jgi:glycosyltransferase involved in cell wall biosynthesis